MTYVSRTTSQLPSELFEVFDTGRNEVFQGITHFDAFMRCQLRRLDKLGMCDRLGLFVKRPL